MSYEYAYSNAGMPTQDDGSKPKRHSRVKVFLALAVIRGALAISAVAAATLLLPKTPQPQDVLPESTLALIVLDGDPSLAQKVNVLRLSQALPRGTFDTFDESDPIGFLITDEKSQSRWERVQPWLGSKFAIALVPDASAEPAPLIAVQVIDETLAEPWQNGQLEEVFVEFGLSEPGPPLRFR